MLIDVTYNYQKECGAYDADKYSEKLQRDHQCLWSKPLPNGQLFTLTCCSQNRLHHKSSLGEFFLSSDRAVNTFYKWKKTKYLVNQIPAEEMSSFDNLAETIGAIMIWPSAKVDGKSTINGARGMNSKISDRLDLTIECIRRYYKDENSPLYETFRRYQDFFRLFIDFRGYIDFFLLQDAVNDDYSSTWIAPPFDNYQTTPVPKSVDEYFEYMKATSAFINARNKRIEEECHRLARIK